MNCDLLSSIFHTLSAVPTSPSHDQLDVTIYEHGVDVSTLLTSPVLSNSDLSEVLFCPSLFVAIRSVQVRAAIQWLSMIPAYQIADSLSDALYMVGGCQVVFCRSKDALLVSGDSAQDIISHCLYLNEKISWGTRMILDSPTGPYVHSENVPVDPLEQFIDFRELAAVYEPVAQPNDLVNDYNGPLFDDWNPFGNPMSYEPDSNTVEPHHYPLTTMYSPLSGVYPVEYSAGYSFPCEIFVTIDEPTFQPPAEDLEIVRVDAYEDSSNSPSPSSTRSSPFPETPANFRSELPRVVSPMATFIHDEANREEQQTNKMTQIIHPACPTSPASAAALSPLSEWESLPSSRCSSAAPQSSERDPISPTLSEEIFQAPTKVVGKKIRRSRTGAIRKKKSKSKEKHFCCYCNESFTRDHDAERHQRTCKHNPNCSQKEQCKVCTKPLPVRLDARRRHWGTLECTDAARKRGYPRMDEEAYECL